MKQTRWRAMATVLLVAFALWKAFPLEEQINLGLDLQGGMHVVLRVDTSDLSEEVKKDAAARALEVIRNRIDQLGLREPSIQRQGQDRIIIQLPGVVDRERALQMVKQTAHLEFRLVSDDERLIDEALAGNVPAGYELMPLAQDELLIERRAVLTGDTLTSARVQFDSARFNEPNVGIQFNPEGARRFGRVTGDNVGRRLAIVLDGTLKSAPVIQERIPSGQAQITGRFSVDEASDLAIVLQAGALPAPVVVEEERTVGPSLGRDSVEQGKQAILVGGALVIGFMATYYLLAGLIANFALVLNMLLILGALGYFGATLTLPGIAGLVLTIGMAVDANVLIFERIREEFRVGKGLRAAVQAGFQRATLTILDANITTMITALILFQFGTGPVRGFAITLCIGLAASMFSALVVSRLMFDLLVAGGSVKRVPMLQLIREPSLNFTRWRRFAYLVSLIMILWGAVTFWQRGQANFGIDFSGGTLMQLRFDEPLPVNQFREVLRKAGLEEAPVQQIGTEGRELLVRTEANATTQVLEMLREEIPDNPAEVMRVETVGPTVGEDLRRKAVKALWLSLLGICVYVSLRFEFKFAVAAIVALLHDALISVGALSLAGREISLPVIAALLTIVGYSINDTIVVFDRIREDLKLMRKSSYEQIINTSINQTLSRTILTSSTTLMVVLALFILGGKVINDFAFTLMVGVAVGTYSSVFVASPLLIDWPGRKR